jgi:hypothetical protein
VGHIVNAAGLQADRVARWFGMCDDYAVLPFKGLYWYGDWPAGRLQRHVYPVPDPRNPFLGVHLTVTVDGRAKIGPTALPALWRESYGGLSGFDLRDAAEVARLLPRFLTSRHHDVPALLRQDLPHWWRPNLVREAAKLVPSVQPDQFLRRARRRPLNACTQRRVARLDKQPGRRRVHRGDSHAAGNQGRIS